MTYLAGLLILTAAGVLLGLGLAMSLAFIPPFGEVLLLVGVWLARTGWGVVQS